MQRNRNLMVFFILNSQFLYTQEQPQKRTYFDQYWQPVPTAVNAMYYRTVTPQNGKYLVKDFFFLAELPVSGLPAAGRSSARLKAGSSSPILEFFSNMHCHCGQANEFEFEIVMINCCFNFQS